MKAVRDAPGGALVEVRVRPRSRPAVEVAGERVVIRVASAPVEGRATDEARRALAAALHVSPSSVCLVTGVRSRTKKFLVGGLTGLLVTERLQAYRPVAASMLLPPVTGGGAGASAQTTGPVTKG